MAEEAVQENKEAKKGKRQRIWEIDFLRGFAIFLMVIDHFFWDVKFLPQVFSNYPAIQNGMILWLRDLSMDYWYHPARYATHLVFAAIFFILSGVSCVLSKNNFLHALKILLAGALIDLVTYIAFWATGGSVDFRMIFNVLISLGAGVLLIALLNLIPMPKKARGFLYVGLGVALFVVCCVFDLYWIVDNEGGTAAFQPELIFEYMMGFRMWGSDYFQLIPYLAYTLFGAGIGIFFYQEKKQSLLPKLDGKWNKPFCFIGRNTLWVYLSHQVVLWIIIGGICLILGYRF